jgi:hypothetical protein
MGEQRPQVLREDLETPRVGGLAGGAGVPNAQQRGCDEQPPQCDLTGTRKTQASAANSGHRHRCSTDDSRIIDI